jgi:uncharacterized membrane protein HdeD (DUF308 family)
VVEMAWVELIELGQMMKKMKMMVGVLLMIAGVMMIMTLLKEEQEQEGARGQGRCKRRVRRG